MKVIWSRVFITSILILILLGLFVWYRLSCANPIINSKWTNIEPNLQTGDLLFVRYESKYSKIISIFTGYAWSHTAVVYRDTMDNVYIIEVADYSRYYDEPFNGLCVLPLQKWLELNDGRICGYRKYLGWDSTNTHETPNINEILDPFKGITLDMDLYNWLSGLSVGENKRRHKDSYFCSEFTALLLQKMGLLSDLFDPVHYSPAKLAEISGYSKIAVFYLLLK